MLVFVDSSVEVLSRHRLSKCKPLHHTYKDDKTKAETAGTSIGQLIAFTAAFCRTYANNACSKQR